MTNTKNITTITLTCGKVNGCCIIGGPKAGPVHYAETLAAIKATLCDCDGTCMSAEDCQQQQDS